MDVDVQLIWMFRVQGRMGKAQVSGLRPPIGLLEMVASMVWRHSL